MSRSVLSPDVKNSLSASPHPTLKENIRSSSAPAYSSSLSEVRSSRLPLRKRRRIRTTNDSVPWNLVCDQEENFLIEEVSGTYDHSYNLSYLDLLIRKKIRAEEKSVASLQQEVAFWEEKKKEPQNLIEYREKELKIAALQEKISYFQDPTRLQRYQEQAEPWLSKHQALREEIKQQGAECFWQRGNPSPQNQYFQEAMLHIIRSYFTVARQYLRLNLTYQDNNKPWLCVGCNSSLEEYSSNNESYVICEECSAMNSFRSDDINLGSSRRINTSNRNDYEDQQNFQKFINSFQGITNTVITDSVFSALDVYFKNKNFPPREEICQMEYSNLICRGPSNHQMLFKAFSEIGRSDLNTCVNLVGHLYWNWRLPDISKYVSLILSHYNKTQEVFYRIANKRRQSSICRQWRLYKHLQLLGLKYSLSMFKTSSMEESVAERTRLWEIMCREANDPQIYFMDD